MNDHLKKSALELIQSNIDKHGHHVYLISGGLSPRFAYTIGLNPVVGFELVLAGAFYYSAEEVKHIINEVVVRLRVPPKFDKLSLEVGALGSFSLRKVDISWSHELMLGALDFYSLSEVPAFQIVPDQAHWTIDIPDMTKPWSAAGEPVWQWLREPWQYSVPSHSLASTNLVALRGERVTEAARWEEDQWELFAGAGPDVSQDDVRVVPLGTLLAIDPSLEAVVNLQIGEALWRNSTELDWHPWK